MVPINKKYTFPLSDDQQKEVVEELRITKRELELARRKIQNLEKACNFLSVMNENAERVRDLHEQEIMENKQKAEEASQAKSSFLAQMSHEIRTPMNAIKVLSELLLRTKLDKLQKDYANNIVNAASSLLNIINDILDFSKLDAQMFEIVNVPYDFPSMISDISNIINLRAMDKSIAFITDIDNNIPTMLEGDDLRLKQIFINLLQNAIKFTSEGYVKLVVKGEVSADDTHVDLICSVIDTGIGIDEESQERLFEPFSQADLRKNRKVEGTGLGLSISKSLLELMGGDIELKSEYGKGSEFIFRVPQPISNATPIAMVSQPEKKKILLAGSKLKMDACAQMVENLGIPWDMVTSEAEFQDKIISTTYTHLLYYYDMFQPLIAFNETVLKGINLIAIKDIRYAGRQQTPSTTGVMYDPILIYDLARVIEHANEADNSMSRSEANAVGKYTIHNASVLIVDDNDVNLMVMDQLLRQYNVEAILAKSGMEAVDLTLMQRFDIIFMDHMMPIMNGVEATKKIRDPKNPNNDTPIIIVTANAIMGMREEYLKQGLDDYISKPIDIKELNAVLKRWIKEEKIKEHSNEAVHQTNEADISFSEGLSALGLNIQSICDDMGYNEDTYLAIIETFIVSVPDTLDKLLTCRQQRDYSAFRIHVHGVKSALANIGAKALSKSAQKLEVAAQDGNYSFIEHNFTEFYDALSGLIVGITSILPEKKAAFNEENASAEGLAQDVLHEMLGSIIEHLDNLDSMAAAEKLEEISCGLNVDQQRQILPLLNKIKVDIENFEYEEASEEIKKLMISPD